MYTVDISANFFIGSIILDKLPSSLTNLNIRSHEFSGELRMVEPNGLHVFSAQGNDFEAFATIESDSPLLSIGVLKSGVKVVFKPGKGEHPRSILWVGS